MDALKMIPPRPDAEIKDLVDLAYTGDRYFERVAAIVEIFPRDLLGQLYQLVRNPTWDGDVLSKAGRDRLLDMNIAIRVCAQGQEGFTGSRGIGYSILKETGFLTKSQHRRSVIHRKEVTQRSFL